MKTQFVEMVHPNLPGQTYQAPKQGVGMLQQSGWRLAEEAPPDQAAADQPNRAPADAGASSSSDTDQPPQRRRASEKKGE